MSASFCEQSSQGWHKGTWKNSLDGKDEVLHGRQDGFLLTKVDRAPVTGKCPAWQQQKPKPSPWISTIPRRNQATIWWEIAYFGSFPLWVWICLFTCRASTNVTAKVTQLMIRKGSHLTLCLIKKSTLQQGGVQNGRVTVGSTGHITYHTMQKLLDSYRNKNGLAEVLAWKGVTRSRMQFLINNRYMVQCPHKLEHMFPGTKLKRLYSPPFQVNKGNLYSQTTTMAL